MKNPAAICLTGLLFLIALCAPPSVSAQARDAQSPPPPSTAEIIKGLQSQNPAEREQAAKAAAATKPLPSAVVPFLLNSLRGLESKPSNDTVSDAIREQWRLAGDLVTALGNAGAPAIPELSHALDDPDEAVRRGAVDALIVIARGSPEAWPVLVDALGNAHDDVPSRIEAKIEANGNQAVKIVPLLRHSLDDPNPKVRGASAVTLSTILAANGPSYCNSYIDELAKMRSPWTDWKGPSPSDLILDIAKNLKNVDRDKLPQTLNNLCLGPSAKVAIPYLLPLLRDQDGATRFFVLFNLWAMGPAACEAIPDAMRSLKDPDKGVRLKAMAVLGVCGPAAKDAVPQLDVALKSTDAETAQQAALALANIDPSHDGLLPVLTQMLDPSSDDPAPRQNAVQALDEMGSYARLAVPALIHLIATDTDTDDGDDRAPEREAQVTALVHIDGADAIPELQHVISTDKDDEVRIAAVTALGGLGQTTPRAISALIGALNNDSDTVRDAASEALGKLGRAAVPALIAALKSPHIYQRAWAVQALGQIKPMPTDAEHALRLALNDKSEIVKTEAAAALKGSKVDASAVAADKQLDEDSDIDDPATIDHGAGQDLDSFVAGDAIKDARIYTKAEIVASIPPDKDHEYPTELKYSVPIGPAPNSATNAAFLATVHAAQDGVDRLAVWKKTGDDQYQRLFVQETSSENHFDKPEVFSSKVLVTGQGKDHDETALFLNLPLHRVWGDGEGIDDNVFVLDGDELRPVAIADAEEGSKQLRDGETVWNGGMGNDFKDNDLEFSFGVWPNGAACHACVGPYDVDGNYKVVKEMHYDAQNKDWSAKWKMVVDTAKRVRRPEN
ncbi:HEAT repeat domain-containing protein [Candidatus Binatus sp.]|uniref:HEAT repeat domain-containing protein n=1 Tax=Candidatus Binatus sp. TaxID=2811406 RepID=UPI003CC5B6E1